MWRPGRIWLSVADVDRMRREATHWSPHETGGVLLGYRGAAGQVVVAAMIDAGPDAKRSKVSFEPDYEYQTHEIAVAYERSGRRWSYLGDWHSHPNGMAILSRTDRQTLGRIARTAESRAPQPVMILVTTSSTAESQIRAFRLRSRAVWRRSVEGIPITVFKSLDAD